MQTGEDFPIFQDRKDIFIGQQWRERVEKSVNGSTLLIAVITPSFLRSEACREEVRLFANRESRLQRRDLMIPIMYVQTPGLKDVEDEIAMVFRDRQYFVWGDCRFEDMASNEVRRKVATLAEHVVEALMRSRESAGVEIVIDSPPGEDEPGFIELLAEAEDAMPLFTNTIVSLGRVMKEVGESANLAAKEMNLAGLSVRPSSAKLSAIFRFKKRLEEPVTEMEQIADEYLDHLTRVSGGVNALIGRVPVLRREEDIQAARNLLAVLENLAKRGGEGLDVLEDLDRKIVANYPLSSTLRPPFRKMSNAVQKILPSKQEFQNWHSDLTVALAALEDPVTDEVPS